MTGQHQRTGLRAGVPAVSVSMIGDQPRERGATPTSHPNGKLLGVQHRSRRWSSRRHRGTMAIAIAATRTPAASAAMSQPGSTGTATALGVKGDQGGGGAPRHHRRTARYVRASGTEIVSQPSKSSWTTHPHRENCQPAGLLTSASTARTSAGPQSLRTSAERAAGRPGARWRTSQADHRIDHDIA
jgi:hypothetical protein